MGQPRNQFSSESRTQSSSADVDTLTTRRRLIKATLMTVVTANHKRNHHNQRTHEHTHDQSDFTHLLPLPSSHPSPRFHPSVLLTCSLTFSSHTPLSAVSPCLTLSPISSLTRRSSPSFSARALSASPLPPSACRRASLASLSWPVNATRKIGGKSS